MLPPGELQIIFLVLESFKVCMFWQGFNLRISPFSGDLPPPSNTKCHLTMPVHKSAKRHWNLSNALGRGHKRDRRQTDRPRYENCVAIGTIITGRSADNYVQCLLLIRWPYMVSYVPKVFTTGRTRWPDKRTKPRMQWPVVYEWLYNRLNLYAFNFIKTWEHVAAVAAYKFTRDNKQKIWAKLTRCAKAYSISSSVVIVSKIAYHLDSAHRDHSTLRP